MRKYWLLLVLVLACGVGARERFYEKGVLVEMNSVSCGYDEKSGKSITGSLLGTDAGSKKTKEMLCQEYVLRAERITYRIRPKDDKPHLLPVGEEVEFRIDKDKLKLRSQEYRIKEKEYIVVSMTPREEPKDAKVAKNEKPQQ